MLVFFTQYYKLSLKLDEATLLLLLSQKKILERFCVILFIINFNTVEEKTYQTKLKNVPKLADMSVFLKLDGLGKAQKIKHQNISFENEGYKLN